jgi:hypothetical protein
MTRSLVLNLGAALAIGLSVGCGIVGPTCLARQQTGSVDTLSGIVRPGSVEVRQVAYGTDGSQNNLQISWPGQRSADGPQLRVFATRLECTDFTPPERDQMPSTSGACGTIGSVGGQRSPNARPCVTDGTCPAQVTDIVQTSLTIPSGRGNPDIIAPGAEYKLWIIGDATQEASYTIAITWFFGPDC